ncbi:hypothetical protein M8C21_026838 [Ambrosia artemisiifolia]|uniref:Uncharacterized protein n=1 Tax=Ambrosia artemisiifolia TaxID=4212 RepID=A0AAD5GUG0_AMBAR|nr:hypothetical protein M8C21_026838 [Ambrosia artemisiifolia]
MSYSDKGLHPSSPTCALLKILEVVETLRKECNTNLSNNNLQAVMERLNRNVGNEKCGVVLECDHQ